MKFLPISVLLTVFLLITAVYSQTHHDPGSLYSDEKVSTHTRNCYRLRDMLQETREKYSEAATNEERDNYYRALKAIEKALNDNNCF